MKTLKRKQRRLLVVGNREWRRGMLSNRNPVKAQNISKPKLPRDRGADSRFTTTTNNCKQKSYVRRGILALCNTKEETRKEIRLT